MRKFTIYLILLLILGFDWNYISTVSLNFIKENDTPIVRQFIIKKWIEDIKTIQPHCVGASIKFIESDIDEDLIDVYAVCNKWGI